MCGRGTSYVVLHFDTNEYIINSSCRKLCSSGNSTQVAPHTSLQNYTKAIHAECALPTHEVGAPTKNSDVKVAMIFISQENLVPERGKRNSDAEADRATHVIPSITKKPHRTNL